MLLQIHDELLFEGPRAEVETVTPIIREQMEGALKLEVPIKVDVRVGKNWYEAHA